MHPQAVLRAGRGQVAGHSLLYARPQNLMDVCAHTHTRWVTVESDGGRETMKQFTSLQLNLCEILSKQEQCVSRPFTVVLVHTSFHHVSVIQNEYYKKVALCSRS